MSEIYIGPSTWWRWQSVGDGIEVRACSNDAPNTIWVRTESSTDRRGEPHTFDWKELATPPFGRWIPTTGSVEVSARAAESPGTIHVRRKEDHDAA